VRSTQVTPGGIRVCGHQPLTAEELAAVDELARLVSIAEERRRAALSPEERAAEDARRAESAARLRCLQERARRDR
jgi:hypothetical protein